MDFLAPRLYRSMDEAIFAGRSHVFNRCTLPIATGRYEGAMGTTQTGPDPALRGARKALRAEKWLFGGSTALILGISLSLSNFADLGAQLTLAGFVAAVVGLHLLGRSGPCEKT